MWTTCRQKALHRAPSPAATKQAGRQASTAVLEVATEAHISTSGHNNSRLLPCLQGEWLLQYKPISERPPEAEEVGAEDLGPVPMSKAYVRRISGKNWQ